MIPQTAITAWRNIAPWGSPDQVEKVQKQFLERLKGEPWQGKNE